MKGKTAFNAMEGIDPRYILEAAPDAAAPVAVGRRTKFLRLAAVAAALAVVVAVGAVVAPMLMKEPATPAETSRFTLQRVYKSHYSDEAWGPDGATNMYVQAVDWAEHPEGQVFVLNGVEYPLTYQKSLYYPSQDSVVHEYLLEIDAWKTDDAPYVLLTDDGTLFRTGYFNMAQIDMTAVKNDDDLIRLVEEAMADFVDFDAYEFVEISSEDYRVIKWYNQLGDYRLPDSVRLGITPEGYVNNMYKDVPHEITMTETDIPTDDIIRALVAEDVKETEMALYGPVQLGAVCHKEIIEQDGVECLYVYVETEYIVKFDTEKEYVNKQNLWYVIPIIPNEDSAG